MALPPDLTNRLADAKRDRNNRQGQINDYLSFADPAQPRIGDALQGTTDRAVEIQTLYDGTLMEVHEDFASDLVDRVMPRGRDWLKYEPDESLDEAARKYLEPEFAARTTRIFSAIRQSNLYEEAAGEWAGGLAHGTGAMSLVDPGKGLPLRFEAISPSQLLLGRGPGGGLSFKARDYMWALEDAMAFWPKYDWKAKHRRMLDSKTQRRNLVRIYECATAIPDEGDERWKWQVAVDDEMVFEDEFRGRGSCPLIVSRWRTISTSAWGIGPGLKVLPDQMTLNQERRLVLKNLGKMVDPPTVYDDDGVLNPEGGVGAGDWLPRLPGSRVEQMKQEGVIEAAYYEQGGLQDNIRRGLYQYGPRQRGKTPPTASQWMDEKTEEGRRLELPTGKVYAEGPIQILNRVEYLLTKRGALDPAITHNKQLVHLRPMSPLARQQASEDVAMASQVMGTIRTFADPNVIAAQVDVRGTIENIKTALGEKLIELLPKEQAQTLLGSVLGGSPDGAQGAQPGASA